MYGLPQFCPTALTSGVQEASKPREKLTSPKHQHLATPRCNILTLANSTAQLS